MKRSTIFFIIFFGFLVIAKSQIPNSGFELWPLSTNGYPVNTGIKSTDHYLSDIGSYSVMVQNNLNVTTMNRYGFVNSAFYAGYNGPTFPISGCPTKLCGYYKFLPENVDTLHIGLTLYKNGVPVAGAQFINYEKVSEWTSFCINISEYTEADSAQIGFAAFFSEIGKRPAGPHGNSILYIDNLSFDKLITSANNKKVAIIKNFDDSENDSIISYLSSMGIESKLFDHNVLTYDSISNYNLLIWDDLGYQSGGLSDSNVTVFKQFYQSGKPLYLIGDDLAYSSINLSETIRQEWIYLTHLSGENNFCQESNVQIVNNSHPIINGYYGFVNNFDYSLDIDYALKTNTGEILLAKTIDSDVILVFEGQPAKTVIQNCLIIQSGSEESVIERKKLFKNAVSWLLDLWQTSFNQVYKKDFTFQVIPNPTTNGFYLPQDFELKDLSIYNLQGEKMVNISQINNFINVDALQKGIYIVHITKNNEILNGKIIKK